MNEINPFQSPQIMDRAVKAEVVATSDMPAAIWRDGRFLVMRKHVTLPDICVKSNQASQGPRLKRVMYWHHPAVFVTVLAGLLVYVILALVLRKSATVWVPLTEAWWARRRRAIAIACGLVAAGLLSLFLGIGLNFTNDLAGLGILFGIALLIAGAIAPRMIAPHKINDDFVWIKGVHPDYLARLPEYRG